MALEIGIIGETGEEQRREVSDSGLTFRRDDGTTVEPTITQRVEYDASGEDSTTTTVCGETEQRKESESKPDLVVEGILSFPDMNAMKSIQNQNVDVTCPIHTGEVYVKRLTIEDNAKLHKIYIDGEDYDAYKFQTQLRQP